MNRKSSPAVRPSLALRPTVDRRSAQSGVRWTVGLGLAVVALAVPTGPASASDGVLEINQACATQTGCFLGDTAGYPVTIDGSAGRSYRLSSDLVVPDENTSGITVSAPNTSIDLNGFEIVRAACVGATTNCTPTTGSSNGIEVTTTSVRGVSVRNGSIVGMGAWGVFLGDQAEVRNLRVRWNRTAGIYAVSGLISGNSAQQNGESGIATEYAASVSGNSAYGNGVYGITAGIGSVVSNNTAADNGSSGIRVSFGSIVQGNTVYSNDGFGLGFTGIGNKSGYRENVISDNAAGTVSGTSAVNLGDNACNGTTTCP